MSYMTEQLLTSKLYLTPKDLNQPHIDNLALHKLKENVEGLCYKDGYIINDSVNILKRSIGEIVTKNNKRMIKYSITYKAKVISPSPGDEIESYVDNINKMGIIAYIRLGKKENEKLEDSPLIIIIPKEYIDESQYNINDIMNGQKLTIQVIGERTKYKTDKIQIVARPL